MSVNTQQPQGVHLVGSVPLETNRAVFEMSHSLLGQHIRRIPDGETGARTNWISWQFAVLTNTPQLEPVPPREDGYGRQIPQVRVKEGLTASDVVFDSLGYSTAAIDSYQGFSKMKQAGQIAPDCRFQVCLPTPLAPIQFYVAMEDRATLEPVYEAKLLAELDEIVAAIPADELAIQWDTAAEFGVIEGVFPSHLQNARDEIMTRLLRLGNHVPEPVELGYHLCYGDAGHKHFVEPEDTSHLVDIANGLASNLNRPLNWIHLPVPRGRDDEAFFLPLNNLALPAEAELYLGLVHMTDGVEGAKRRIQAAQTVVDTFGVATECGFGRRPADTIPELMGIHTAVSSEL
ncbi:MAG: hypothetical protein AAF485_09290 [Chloroflexota bacterium]